MKDQNKSNNIKDIIDPYEELSDMHKKAVDMRLEFFKYKVIAKELGVAEQTVGSWFYVNGLCRAAYEYKAELRKKENEAMILNAKKELEDLIPEAITVIKNKLGKYSLDAALKLLAINGISAIEKVQVDHTNKENISKLNELIETFKNDTTRDNSKDTPTS